MNSTEITWEERYGVFTAHIGQFEIVVEYRERKYVASFMGRRAKAADSVADAQAIGVRLARKVLREALAALGR